MANVRRPRSDADLRREEREMLVERLQLDELDTQQEQQQMLADAGEPEALAAREDAVEALRRAHRGVVPLTPADEELSQEPVEDPRETVAREQQQRERLGRQRFEQHQVKQQMDLETRGRGVLDLHWRRWSKEGTRNYAKACRQMQLGIGRDAVLLWQSGVFDSMLAVAKFIQSFQLPEREQESHDWQSSVDKELAELRGEGGDD